MVTPRPWLVVKGAHINHTYKIHTGKQHHIQPRQSCISFPYQLFTWSNTERFYVTDKNTISVTWTKVISNEVAFSFEVAAKPDAISNEAAFSCEVAYLFPVKWP